MNRLYDFVRRFPLPIIIAFAILMVVANRVHSQRAHYDFTFQTMAPKGTPEFAVFDEFVELFGEDNDVFLIAFTADPLVTNKNLALIDRITRRIEALDSTSTVSSLTNVRDIRGSEDGLDVTEFLEPTPLSAGALRSAREALTTDPIVAGGLISSDGRTTAILGRMREWSNDPRTRVNYFEKIDAILAEEGRGQIEFHLAGVPQMDRTLMNHIDHDTEIFIPATILTLGGLLWLAFRQIRAMWMPLMPAIIASSATLGALSFLGFPMSVLTGQGVMSTLIMVIGLSDGVHLMNRYGEDVGNDPTAPRLEALRNTLKHMGPACFLTSFTTGIGFIALASSEIPTMRDFGIFGTLGISLAYVGAVVLLPACIVIGERVRKSRPLIRRNDDSLDRILRATSAFVAKRPWAIVIAAVLIMIAATVSARNIRIDNRFTQDLRAHDPTVVSMHFLQENLGGVFPVDILVNGGTHDAVKDPRVLAAMDHVSAGLEKLPTISKVNTPVAFIKKMNRAMNEGKEQTYRLPVSRDLVAQYLLLFEMSGGDNEFDRLVTYDYSVARMTAMMDDGPPSVFYTFVDRLHELIGEADFPDGIEVYESGDQPLFYSVSERLVSTLIGSLYYAMPLILLVTAIAFRSVKLALISILPNVFPLTVGMGLLGATDISLRFATMVAFPVAFGLAIDDTIHFLARYRIELARGRSIEEAISVSLTTSGRAMVLTTVFLLGGYAVMFTSNFLGIVHMGVVICTILTAALVGDLFVLPALLLIVRPRFNYDGRTLPMVERESAPTSL